MQTSSCSGPTISMQSNGARCVRRFRSIATRACRVSRASSPSSTTKRARRNRARWRRWGSRVSPWCARRRSACLHCARRRIGRWRAAGRGGFSQAVAQCGRGDAASGRPLPPTGSATNAADVSERPASPAASAAASLSACPRPRHRPSARTETRADARPPSRRCWHRCRARRCAASTQDHALTVRGYVSQRYGAAHLKDDADARCLASIR